MPLEMKSKAELAAMIAERLGVPASQVMIHKHSTPWGVTVVGVTGLTGGFSATSR